MDKKKIVDWVVNQSSTHRLQVTLLWLLSALAVILLNFQTMAYAADDSAGSSDQEQSLIVRNWKGDYIGTSHYVIMDPSAGEIVFVIVSIETGQDKEIKEVAVPWVLFSIDKGDGALVLNISKKRLDSAPEYHDYNLEDPEFIGGIYHFFGVAPPWTEETPQGKPMGL
jgi:hypothetical protein